MIFTRKFYVFIVYSAVVVFIIAMVNSGISNPLRHYFQMNIPNLDKLGHFFFIGLFNYLLLELIYELSFGKTAVAFFAAAVFSVLACTIEEFSQIFLEHRSFQFTDLAADYLGIFFSSVLFLIRRYKTINLKT